MRTARVRARYLRPRIGFSIGGEIGLKNKRGPGRSVQLLYCVLRRIEAGAPAGFACSLTLWQCNRSTLALDERRREREREEGEKKPRTDPILAPRLTRRKTRAVSEWGRDGGRRSTVEIGLRLKSFLTCRSPLPNPYGTPEIERAAVPPPLIAHARIPRFSPLPFLAE